MNPRADTASPSRLTDPPPRLDLLRHKWGASAVPYAAAAGAVAGAWLLTGVAVPLAAVIAAALICVWRPKPLVVVIAVAVLTGFLGSRALAGLDDPISGHVEGWVTLLEDPKPLAANRGVRVTVRYDDARLEARAYGAVASRLDDLLAGERARITGTAKPANSDWHRWRHVTATVNVATVGESAAAAPLAAFTNQIRRFLDSGARSLPDDSRAMFAGMVYGDDRSQSPRLYDDFRAAGLGHLLVVSGQNVAFVLALASPLVTRTRPGVRLLVLLMLLGVFAVLTRFEPSVLRAVTMAGVAVISTALGRPETGRRALAWAVAAVIVVDPFLVRVLAFQLSVCATCGILWITPALAAKLRGPAPLRLAVATTAGAQLGVMPLLVAVFGSVPVASFPANVAAGPATAPVMMWGLTGGLGAGLLGESVAWLIHRPTAALLWWVRSVAETAAAAPPAMITSGSAVVLASGVILLLVAPKLDHASGFERWLQRLGSERLGSQRLGLGRSLGWLGVLIVVVTLAYSVITAASPAPGWSQVDSARLFRQQSTVIVVVEASVRPRDLLESLRLAGVREVDLVVASGGGASDAHAVLAIRDRYRRAAVVAPPLHRVPNARTVRAGDSVRVGSLEMQILSDEPRLEVKINSKCCLPSA